MRLTCRVWLRYKLLSPLGILLLTALAGLAAADNAPNRIRIEYVPPTNPAHQPLYDMVKGQHALEKLQQVFAPFKYPMDVTIRTVGCNGHVNSWYAEPVVTLCYEYLEEIRRDMPKDTTALGVTPLDAEIGQFFFAAAHEMGHASFDQLGLPLFGRQEDDADQFATYIMLQFGKTDARRLIAGAAHSYQKYLLHPEVTAPLKDFSDAHGAPEQRYFNLLCLAYGADPVLFGDFVEKKYLPEHRAEGCRYEYGNVNWAFKQLIDPHLEHDLTAKFLDRTWLAPETPTRTTIPNKGAPAPGGAGGRALQ
jgi:hypothetical protein